MTARANNGLARAFFINRHSNLAYQEEENEKTCF